MIKLLSILLMICLVGFSSPSHANSKSEIDLSSPKKALKTTLKVSKSSNLKLHSSILSLANKRKLLGEIKEAKSRKIKKVLIQTENPFEKWKILDVSSDDTKAVVKLKVKYNSKWLKKREKIDSGQELTGAAAALFREFDDGPAKTVEKLKQFWMIFPWPCAVEGKGYAAYVFEREKNKWKLVKGMTSPTPFE